LRWKVFIYIIIKWYYISGPDVAVLRSVSEDDLTNVVQLSPLGKQDHRRRAVLYRAAASNPHYFCKLDPDPDLHQSQNSLEAQNRAAYGRGR
jgi:hypothetical protein